MTLRIYFQLFGPLSIQLPDRSEPISRFRTQATGALAGFLAYHAGMPHQREALIEMLWPDQRVATGRNNLSLALSSLRRIFEASAAGAGLPGVSHLLLTDRQTVTLPTEGIQTDVAQFEESLAAAYATEEPADQVSPEALGHLDRAIGLYYGDLLSCHQEEWILGERLRLRERYLLALRQIAGHHIAIGNTGAALGAALRAVAAEPYHERHHQILMELYLRAGQPERTLRQYQQMRQRMRDLDLSEPTPEIRLLAQTARRLLLPKKTAAARHHKASLFPSAFLSVPRAPDAYRHDPVSMSGPATAQDPLQHSARSGSPAPYSLILGREKEREHLLHWLCDPSERLVTITGPAGIGKTRLAREAVTHLHYRAADAATWIVLLEGIADPARLPELLEETLGVRAEDGDDGVSARLRRCTEFLLRQSSPVLVLDSPERLLCSKDGGDATAAFVTELLTYIPTLHCLVASQQPLRLSFERRLPLFPLEVPSLPGRDYDSGIHGSRYRPVKPVDILCCASVALFAARAQSVAPDFQVTANNASEVAALCRCLGGNPLAIEMAAARVAEMTPAQMLVRLTEAPETLLVAHYRDVPGRHRSMQAAFAWSYELLPQELRRLLRRLSVFPDTFTAEAAEAVLFPSQPEDAGAVREGDRPQLSSLLDCSAIIPVPPPAEAAAAEPARFRIPKEMRPFAFARFMNEYEAGRRETLLRFVDYYRNLVETAAPRLFAWEAPSHLRHLDAERHNLRAALAICLRESQSDAETGRSYRDLGLRLCLGLHRYWTLRACPAEGLSHLAGFLPDGRPGTDAVIRRQAPADDDARYRRECDALLAAADLADRSCRPQEALEFARESLRLSGPRRDTSRIAAAVVAYISSAKRENSAGGCPLGEKAVRLARSGDDPMCLAASLETLGVRLAGSGAAVFRTLRLLRQSLALYQRCDDMYGVVRLLGVVGNLYLKLSYTVTAESLFKASLAINERLDNSAGIAAAQRDLARVAHHQGHYPESLHLLRRSLRLFKELETDDEYAESLHDIAVVAAAAGDLERAWEVAELTRRLRSSVSIPAVDAAATHLLCGHILLERRDLAGAAVEHQHAERLLGPASGPAREAPLFLLQGRLEAERRRYVAAAANLHYALKAAAAACRVDLAVACLEALAATGAAAGAGGDTPSLRAALPLKTAAATLRVHLGMPAPCVVAASNADIEEEVQNRLPMDAAAALRAQGAAAADIVMTTLWPYEGVAHPLRFDPERWWEPPVAAGNGVDGGARMDDAPSDIRDLRDPADINANTKFVDLSPILALAANAAA